jgi:signal transduction histidine kinase
VALGAFLAPTLLGRQALARSQMFLDADHAYHTSKAALGQLSQRIHEERFDERRLIAADLHDEVLQPLFKVTLMAHVLKADLASGRLLDIDHDLPELLSAAEIASTSLRDLIGDLRRSRVGPAGLESAIQSLVRTARKQSSATIEVDVRPDGTEDETELVIYHLVKEALTNAILHAQASRIRVQLYGEGAGTHVCVEDDGTGFDVLTEHQGHYGIQIMRERVQSAGGQIYIDSKPGKGTRITALFPTESAR